MSQENVEIVRRGVDAINRGDKTAWLGTFDPDAEMVPARQWPEHAPIRGAGAIWDFYDAVTAAWTRARLSWAKSSTVEPTRSWRTPVAPHAARQAVRE